MNRIATRILTSVMLGITLLGVIFINEAERLGRYPLTVNGFVFATIGTIGMLFGIFFTELEEAIKR